MGNLTGCNGLAQNRKYTVYSFNGFSYTEELPVPVCKKYRYLAVIYCNEYAVMYVHCKSQENLKQFQIM
jgi:hypothetical protein